MQRPRLSRSLTVAALIAVVFTIGTGSARDLALRALVGGTDCGRFTDPAVDIATEPDPEYDGTDGETVTTLELADERSAAELLDIVVESRNAEIEMARRSVDLARSAGPAMMVQATISFGRTMDLREGLAVALGHGLRPVAVSHAYLGKQSLFVGEIPTVSVIGDKKLDDIVEEYRDLVTSQARHLGILVKDLTEGEPPDAPPIVGDVQARLDAAVQEGPTLIGVIAEGTVQQVSDLTATATEMIVAAAPPGCDPQNAIVPAAWVPMLAKQMTDLPESNEVPLLGMSPGPEGRT